MYKGRDAKLKVRRNKNLADGTLSTLNTRTVTRTKKGSNSTLKTLYDQSINHVKWIVGLVYVSKSEILDKPHDNSVRLKRNKNQ